MVLVPYRGLIFLNSKKDFVGELQEVFPSPTGDLYFSIVPVLTSHAGLNPFPSPTGDLYFSIVHVKSEITDFPSFPSPTGDLYFSIFIGVVTIVGTSFRPLPGTYISQYHLRNSLETLTVLRNLRGK